MPFTVARGKSQKHRSGPVAVCISFWRMPQTLQNVGDVGRVEVLEDVQEEKIRTCLHELFDVPHELVVDLDQLPLLPRLRFRLEFEFSHDCAIG